MTGEFEVSKPEEEESNPDPTSPAGEKAVRIIGTYPGTDEKEEE